MSSGPGVKAIQPALQSTSIGREEMRGKLIRAAITILVPVLILLAPVPADLPVAAWKLFAIYIGAILGMMLRPVPEAVVLLVAIAIADNRCELQDRITQPRRSCLMVTQWRGAPR